MFKIFALIIELVFVSTILITILKSTRETKNSTLYYNLPIKVLFVFCSFGYYLFAILTILNTNRANNLVDFVILIGMGLVFLLIMLEIFLSKYDFDENQLKVQYFYSTEKVVDKNNIDEINENIWLNHLIVLDKNGRKVWLPLYLSGLDKFRSNFEN